MNGDQSSVAVAPAERSAVKAASEATIDPRSEFRLSLGNCLYGETLFNLCSLISAWVYVPKWGPWMSLFWVWAVPGQYLIWSSCPHLKTNEWESPEMEIVTEHDKGVSAPSLIRRQSAAELEIFRRRWQRAAQEDKSWVDPFEQSKKRKRRIYKKPVPQHRHPQ
eukprot:Gb_06350 [translate_table: standard]